MTTVTVALSAVLSFATLASAACSPASGCDDAVSEMATETLAVCSEAQYTDSHFCRTCVGRSLMSFSFVNGACVCTRMTFDEGTCLYSVGAEARTQIRGAIDFAERTCGDFVTDVDGPPERRDADTSSAAPDVGIGRPDVNADASTPRRDQDNPSSRSLTDANLRDAPDERARLEAGRE